MMNNNYTLKFGNVSAMEKDRQKWTDLFEEYYNDDGTLVAFSKETYDHDPYSEDNYQFKYKLCIKGEAMASFVGYDEDGHNDVHIELLLVPLPECLNDKIKSEIAHCMGVETEQVDLYDIVSYGCCPYLDRDCITLNNDADFYDITENEEVVRMLDACATNANTNNSLRGFCLDRKWNMIGSTGWDLIDEMINGNSFVEATLNRYKERMAIV